MTSEAQAGPSGRFTNVMLACLGCAASGGAVFAFIEQRLEVGGLLALAAAVCFSGAAISDALRSRR